MSLSTGSPQGCVLSYILYTDDRCSQHVNRHILKFADDCAIVFTTLKKMDMALFLMILSFGAIMHFCNLKWLRQSICLSILGASLLLPRSPASRASQWKLSNLISILIDNKLNLNANTEMLCLCSQQWLFCLRKLATFQMDKTILEVSPILSRF